MAGNEPVSQRSWRAACPNCGAPVEFRSAASTSAVCGFCRSTLARDGEQIRRTGEVAELFDDHSPLQLGASGKLQGVAFTLIGRVQLAYEGGSWNEWHALFDNGRSAWLSEDNGAYVLSFETKPEVPLPKLAELRVGARVSLAGSAWDVSSVVTAHVLSAQGELPHALAGPEHAFPVVELRNARAEVASLDFSDRDLPQLTVGRSATLAELAVQGLLETSEKNLAARALNCPQCGAALEARLAQSKALSCFQCHALIDLSDEAGVPQSGFKQPPHPPNGRGPQIPLGTAGRLGLEPGAASDWQVVGYMVREDIPDDGESPTPWSEYLLFNRTEGFAFLVDSSEGWSVVRPLTGSPQLVGQRALWQGQTFQQGSSYVARVSWVEGEFYWRVQRDERADVTDYAGVGQAAGLLMSREQTGSELTWSAGRQLQAQEVAAAFKLSAQQQLQMSQDVKPMSAGKSGMGIWTMLLLFALVVLLMLLLSRCSTNECDDAARAYGLNSAEHRQCLNSRGGSGRVGGGSYGGYSSGGGGHK